MYFPDRPDTTLPQLQAEVVRRLAPVTKAAEGFTITDVAVGTTQTAVRHGLRTAPTAFFTQLVSTGGPVRRSAVSDANFIYLIATSACTVDLLVVP